MHDPERWILDPTGNVDADSDATLAPRPRALGGKTLGLLDNGKPNGSVLLREIGDHLQQRHRLRDVLMLTKGYFGTPVERTQVEEIVERCNFAVAAIGD